MYNLFLIFASVIFFLQPSMVLAKTNQPLATCEALSERLSEKTPLAELNIQLGPSSFFEQNSRQELPFSKVLSECFATSLSARGAVVSVREQGEKPLRMLGVYQLRNNQINITVRIRQMGKTISSDLAVAQITIDRDELQEAWFQSDLATLANGLIKEIEKNLAGFDDPIVMVEQPQPGIKGQPTLQFGTELRKQLEQAVSNSELLGASSIGVKRAPYHLQTRYSRFKENIRVDVHLLGPDNKSAALAQADMSQQQMPPEWFALLDDRDLSVCIQYKQRDRRDVKEDSVQASSLIDGISGALARYNTKSTACDGGSSNQGLRIVASMRLTEKNTRDGYGLMRGDLNMTILNNDGKVISTLSAKEKIPFSGGVDTAVEKLIENIFDDAFQEELATRLLSK